MLTTATVSASCSASNNPKGDEAKQYPRFGNWFNAHDHNDFHSIIGVPMVRNKYKLQGCDAALNSTENPFYLAYKVHMRHPY